MRNFSKLFFSRSTLPMVEVSNLNDIDPDLNYFGEPSSISESSSSPYLSISEFNSLLKNSSSNSNLTIFNHNIRSFRMNSSMMLSIFDTQVKYPDVFILTETWFTPNYQDNILGYNSFHTIREHRSGGVSVFIAENFQSTLIERLSYANENIEVCCVEANFFSEQYILIGIYRPVLGNLDLFLSELNSVLNDNRVGNKNIVIAGDLNLDLLADSQISNSFIDNMYTLHFLPVISKPTRFSPHNINSSTLLDQIWVNKVVTYSSGILLTDITDHLPTFIILPISNSSRPHLSEKIKITFRDESEINLEKFGDLLGNFDWSSIKSNDASIYVENFSGKIFEFYNQSFPLKVKYVSAKKSLNPWINGPLLKLIEAKSLYFNLYRQGLVSKSENNFYKNRVKRILDKAKISYFNKLFNNARNNIRSTWRIIKSLTSPNSKVDKISSLVSDGVEYSEEGQMANIFSNYFSSIASDLDVQLPIIDFDPLFYVNPINSNMFLTPVNPQECAVVIARLKNSNHSINPCPVRIFKKFKEFFSYILSDMINLAFQSGTFPCSLKSAIVTPVFKNGVKSDPSNYRPISVTSFISKIFEKLILNRLINFLNSNSVLSPRQFGFTKNRSTKDALTTLTENLYDSLNSNEVTISIFIDYKKAFDTINHSILLRKLQLYGIRGLPLQLLKTYLSDRQQTVKLGDSYSSSKIVNIGVPQGTILGPILFLIYINDLPNISELCNSIMFADDTTLTFRHSNYSQLVTTCNVELVKFHTWSVANRLSINYSKTCCMLFTNRRINDPPSIYMNNFSLDFESSVKFLGVILDSKLKFDQHIRSVCNKVSRSIGILYKLKGFVPHSCLKTIYYSFVHPYLLYGLIIWGGTYAIHLNPIVVLQKRCIRLVCDAPYLAHSNPLFASTKILKLSDMYKFEVANYIFNIKSDPNLNRSHNYETRNRNLLLPTFQRLSLTQHSIYFIGIQFWNNLPPNIKSAERRSLFRKQLKNYLLSSYTSA